MVSAMNIKYFGLSCFTIKRGDATLITDPFDPRNVGLSYSQQEADMVVYTKPETAISDKERDKVKLSQLREKQAKPLIEVTEPGEFEVGGIFVRKYDTTGLVIINVDNVTICYLGLSKEIDKDVKFDAMGSIDYLIVPVGNGGDFMEPKKVDALIKEIDPGVVIPSCYKIEGMKDAYSNLGTLGDFLKEAGVSKVVQEKKLKLQPAPVSEDVQYKIVELEISKS
jgi:L-ascorbate metabolism protein UlaG (beta-lactamase superfamily)